MPLLIPDPKNRRPRGAITGRRRGGKIGGGIWRLLACTEGSRDTAGEEEEDDGEKEGGGDAWATRRRAPAAVSRPDQRRPRKKKATERQRRDRERRQASGASADEATATSSWGGSSVDRRRRPTRSPDRRGRGGGGGLRLRRPRPPIGSVGDVAESQRRLRQTSVGGSAAAGGGGEPRRNVGSPPHGGGRRRRKRLVVAMLDDGGEDDDGATPRRNRNPDHRGHAGTVKLRATRNERCIQRILRELSITLDAADSRALPEFATLEIPSSSAQRSPQKSPAVAATSNTMTMQPSPLAMPTLPTQPPPPPPPHLRSVARAQPPLPPHAVSLAGRGKAEPAVGQIAQQQLQQSNQQQQQQQSLCDYQRQQQHQQQAQLLEQVLMADYAVSQRAPRNVEQTVRGNGRRGYRLFRQVFSAADNYYAVPFPPLEKIKLNDDDDQWENLEIYVASHKGTVAIKSRAGKQQQMKQPEAEAGVRRPLKEQLLAGAQTSAIPRPIANPARKEPLLRRQKQLQPAQRNTAMAAPTIATSPGGDQLTKRASLQQQQQQQQLSKPTQATQLPPNRSARAGPLETPTTRHFGYKQQQQQQQQQQQLLLRARRANPLSPNRLLSQLRQGEPAGRPTMLTPPPSTGNARASQLPRYRCEPTAAAASGGSQPTTTTAANRYGKLSAKLPY